MRHYVLDVNLYERMTIGETVSFPPLTGRMKIATSTRSSSELRLRLVSTVRTTDTLLQAQSQSFHTPSSPMRNFIYYVHACIKDSPTRNFQPFTQSSWLPSRYVRQVGAWEANRQESAERSAYHVRGCLGMPLAISLSAVIIIVSVLTPSYLKNDVNNHWRVVNVSTPCFGVSWRGIHPSGVARQQCTLGLPRNTLTYHSSNALILHMVWLTPTGFHFI